MKNFDLTFSDAVAKVFTGAMVQGEQFKEGVAMVLDPSNQKIQVVSYEAPNSWKEVARYDALISIGIMSQKYRVVMTRQALFTQKDNG